ncbi:nuclear transport factor 2 family protein [Parafrankia sp. FMc2]|uniref:nuclear transport factor 2 family protein n=1 Tax=Parafrankia sp. FMc2 TaxID=3233196 RepID=UPI0034D4588F
MTSIMTSTHHDASIVRLRDAINGHDPAAVAACFTEDYRTEVPLHPSQGFTGNQKVRENWTAILARTPDLHADVLRSTSDGAETWSEWEMRGTATDGAATLIRGVVISGAADGRIAWTRFFLDPVFEAS